MAGDRAGPGERSRRNRPDRSDRASTARTVSVGEPRWRTGAVVIPQSCRGITLTSGVGDRARGDSRGGRLRSGIVNASENGGAAVWVRVHERNG